MVAGCIGLDAFADHSLSNWFYNDLEHPADLGDQVEFLQFRMRLRDFRAHLPFALIHRLMARLLIRVRSKSSLFSLLHTLLPDHEQNYFPQSLSVPIRLPVDRQLPHVFRNAPHVRFPERMREKPVQRLKHRDIRMQRVAVAYLDLVRT